MSNRTWNIRLTTTAAPAAVDLERYSDELLSALLEDLRVSAAVLSTDLEERTINPLFDVEGPGDVQSAMGVALQVLADAGRTLGWEPVVAGVEAELVEEPVPA